MQYSVISNYSDTGSKVATALFAPPSASKELHALVTPDKSLTGLSATSQIGAIAEAAKRLAETYAEKGLKPVMARWLLSDAVNQAPLLPVWPGTAVSVVEQPPLDGTKAALWLYFMEALATDSVGEGSVRAARPHYTHLFTASRSIEGFGSQTATAAMLEDYDIMLRELGTSLAEGCLRTWFFVRDVDHFYQGVVRGRNEVFAATGLTPSTHFIASTGIGGGAESPGVTVKMDAWSALGLDPRQMVYIQAPDYLNPTYEYGVAFERATAVDYGDRRHLIISGTASIDNKGRIVCQGDIAGQTERMLENVEALLRAADMAWDDLAHRIVYIRDWADYPVVKAIMDKRFPEGTSSPGVIVRAPVCRPGWLIEMECMAVKEAANPDYAPF